MAVRFLATRVLPVSALPPIRNILMGLLALGTVLLATNPAAASNPRYSALVMNADSGDVIYSRSATGRRYPASLTKVMTLYMLFEALEDGELTMETELTVSRRAAGQPPSKIGVEAGTTITVSDAIQALAVRSANDVAVVVAEALSESEWRFGRDMTARAEEMGMDHTRFENASGLPNSRQYSTAQDLAIMAMHMVNDFPQHLHYFQQREFTWGDRTWQSHNHLLENYEGTTGMKTGYIRASGFNLIATVERDGISLVGIVLGGRTVASRDTEMMRVLDLNFERLREDPYFGSRIFSAEAVPVFRPDPNSIVPTAPAMAMAALELNATPTLRPARIPTALVEAPSPILAPETETDTAPAATLMADAGPLLAPTINPLTELITDDTGTEERELRASIDASIFGIDPNDMVLTDAVELPANAIPEADGDMEPFRAVMGSGGPLNWGIHVGTYDQPDLADNQMRHAAVTAPTMLTWGMAAMFPDTSAETRQFAAGFGPMTEDEAMDACANLVATGIACEPMDEVDWNLAIRR